MGLQKKVVLGNIDARRETGAVHDAEKKKYL
jgi:GDP-D-mannose dehydratase